MPGKPFSSCSTLQSVAAPASAASSESLSPDQRSKGGEHLVHLYRTLGSGRSGIDYEFVGVVAASPGGINLPVLGSVAPAAGATQQLPTKCAAGVVTAGSGTEAFIARLQA